VPDLFYGLAARLLADRVALLGALFFGIVVGPLLALSMDHGRLYGVALMAAGWWPVVLLIEFHPDRRQHRPRWVSWFYAFVVDLLALSVVFVLLLAMTKKS
jgi:hypothetical protein